ncbi:MAG TPA: hypothetical protein VFI47_31065 [Acidimicrobiales bacterium]|nr:hypothetical protein [Acidimicrobiales bacterium]
MRFAVETWAPEFGAPVTGDALGESDAAVDVAVERDGGAWAPVAPAGPPAACVLFVDGVERVDARVWVDDGDGLSRQGVCASWAAGVVRCDGRATVVAAEVRRGVLCPGDETGSIATRHGDYRARPVPDVPGGDAVGQALGRARGELEGTVTGAVANASGADHDLLVVDGPLGDRRGIHGAVGYVKAHHVSYLPPAQQQVVGRLAPGERTPLFAVGERRIRYSWYLRLPGPATHAWWGVVRCEASGDLAPADGVALADRVAATLPRFASQPHNDPRAPQNLHPIAGLERELKRRLGDRDLLERALRQAAVTAGASPPAR